MDDKPSATCLSALLLLAGCIEVPPKHAAVTPAAWEVATTKCAANGGINYLWTKPESPVGYRVNVICKNDMRAEFYSSTEAR